MRHGTCECTRRFISQLIFVTTCWRLVRTFAVRFTKVFREDPVSLDPPCRSKKLNVDDLGDCGGDLRGSRGVEGSLETKSDGRQLLMGILHPLMVAVWRAMTSRGWCFWRRRTNLDSFRISSAWAWSWIRASDIYNWLSCCAAD